MSRQLQLMHLFSVQSISAEQAITPKRVFLVDDHPIFRRALRNLIETAPGFTVCGEAGSAREGLSLMRQSTPDVAVIDVSLPGANGIELIKNLRAEQGKLPILVVSMHDESLYAFRALKAGAGGYLMKHETAEEFLSALNKVIAGEIYVSAAVRHQLLHRVVRDGETAAVDPLERLSDREIEVLHLIGEGKNTRTIAEMLNLSVKTIESHRLKIKQKLSVETASELSRYAASWLAKLSVG